jgi:hypothetical protein
VIVSGVPAGGCVCGAVPLTTAAHPANPRAAVITDDSNKKVRHACALELLLKTDWDVFMFPFFPRTSI